MIECSLEREYLKDITKETIIRNMLSHCYKRMVSKTYFTVILSSFTVASLRFHTFTSQSASEFVGRGNVHHNCCVVFATSCLFTVLFTLTPAKAKLKPLSMCDNSRRVNFPQGVWNHSRCFLRHAVTCLCHKFLMTNAWMFTELYVYML